MGTIEDVKNCIGSGVILCMKERIHELLIDKTIATNWWYLTQGEREIIAKYVITNWVYGYLEYVRSGPSRCVGGEGDWGSAWCLGNSLIKFCNLGKGNDHYDTLSACYWSRDKVKEHCYIEEGFYLPVYCVVVYSDGPGFGHSICAIQIKEDQADFNSWQFFQYLDTNIKPGSPHMPCEFEGRSIYVRIPNIDTASCSGYTSSEVIIEWKINKETCKVPSPVRTLKIESVPEGAHIFIDDKEII